MNVSRADQNVVTVEELASSGVRLRIAAMLSSRPATLSELADATGISVQGVLKHLSKLSEMGMLTEKSMPGGRHLRGRKLYQLRDTKVADYSEGDLLVAILGRHLAEKPVKARDAYEELDGLAQDMLILRRRARELSRRMARVLEEAMEEEARVGALIEGQGLSQEEQQIAYLIFAEDEPENARATLKEHYGCADPEAAIKAVSAKIRGARA